MVIEDARDLRDSLCIHGSSNVDVVGPLLELARSRCQLQGTAVKALVEVRLRPGTT